MFYRNRIDKLFKIMIFFNFITFLLTILEISLTSYLIWEFLDKNSKMLKNLNENIDMLPDLKKLVNFACNITHIC